MKAPCLGAARGGREAGCGLEVVEVRTGSGMGLEAWAEDWSEKVGGSVNPADANGVFDDSQGPSVQGGPGMALLAGH